MTCTNNCNQGRACNCTAPIRVISSDGLTVTDTEVEFELAWLDLVAIIAAVSLVAYLIL